MSMRRLIWFCAFVATSTVCSGQPTVINTAKVPTQRLEADLGKGCRFAVTVFGKKGSKSPIDSSKTEVGDVLGWASFDDPPRPVIGQVGPYWICFHECPDGEKAGVIPNFGLWLARRGWPEPQPVPFFADHKFVDPDADLYGE